MRAKIELKWKQRQNHQRVLKARLEQLGQTELWQTISSKSYQVLKEELQTGKLKAVDALRAYQWQAIQSNQTRNNVVWFIEDAEELAAKLDATPEQDRGPMHGIPISVKECYFVKNCDATGGMCQYAHLPVTEDSLAVQLMKSFGAIPYVLTNVPQSMFSLQCSNPLYGVTGNALDPQREAGGSSGGEGSLIGSGGSILGLGSDVGGSLRNPAVFNGIYSLKPTHGRHLSQCGVRNPVEYETIGISCVGGFMSSSAKAVQDAYKILYENIDKSALKDQSIAPVHWRPALNQTRMLKIGYFMTDGKFQSHPGCTRAVKETVAKLKKMGHEVIEFHGPDSERVSDLYLGLMFQDRFKRAYGALSKDVFIDSAVDGVWISAWIMKCPDWIRQWIINPLASLLTSDLPPDPIEDGTTIPPALAEMDTILKEYMNEWDEFNLDLVLTAASYMPPPLKEIIGNVQLFCTLDGAFH